MDDKGAIEIFTKMLGGNSLSDEEREAIHHAIGVLGWTKLIEGWKEGKKRARDKKLDDLNDQRAI